MVGLLLAGLSCFALRVAGADVVLNEIMADNQSAVVNGGKTPDWVELYNTTSSTKDLSGMSLSDDPLVPRKFVFPSSTTIDGQSRLIVWCDDASSAPGLHTGFGLSATGQKVTLYSAATAPVQLDTIAFGLQLADFSIGRVPDGTGQWKLCQPKPWLANAAQTLGAAGNLRVNEFMASSSTGADWFELYNGDSLPVSLGGLSLTDDASEPGMSVIPGLSFIDAGGIQLFWADEDTVKGADHADFKLGGGGESIGLYSGATKIDLVHFGAQQTDVSMGRLPDGASTFVSFTESQSPGKSNYLPVPGVVVNEVLTHTDPPLEDAVEFRNLTGSQVDLTGWYLSNSKNNPRKYRVPDGVVLPANGYVVFYEYQFNAVPSSPDSFNFNSAHGDDVLLSEAKGDVLTGYRVSQEFAALPYGVSMGRVVTSTSSDFAVLSARTFGADDPDNVAEFRMGTGAANAAPIVGPVVINEIMYHPPDIVTGSVPEDNTLDEYIELHNTTDAEVFLFDLAYPANTWRITNAVDFSFVSGTRISARGFLLVVGFNPQTNPTQKTAFRTKYSVSDAVQIVGPWSGKLANDAETIELVRPDTPQQWPHPDEGYVPYVPVDRVTYQDSAPWPAQADGIGSSLHRFDPLAHGNDPANWYADAPSPGTDDGRLEIESVVVSGGRIAISFTSLPRRVYAVDGRSNLATGTWTRLADYPAVATSQTREFSELIGAGAATRFYRLTATLAP